MANQQDQPIQEFKLTDAQLEEYRQLKEESRAKGERMLQLSMAAIGATGAIWAFCLGKEAADNVRYAALVPGLIAVVVMYWVKQLEFSGHRIAKYLRDVLEPKVWGPALERVEGKTLCGWECWLKANWKRFRVYRLPPRVHLAFSWIPAGGLAVFCLRAPPAWPPLWAVVVTAFLYGAYLVLARRVGRHIDLVMDKKIVEEKHSPEVEGGRSSTSGGATDQ